MKPARRYVDRVTSQDGHNNHAGFISQGPQGEQGPKGISVSIIKKRAKSKK